MHPPRASRTRSLPPLAPPPAAAACRPNTTPAAAPAYATPSSAPPSWAPSGCCRRPTDSQTRCEGGVGGRQTLLGLGNAGGGAADALLLCALLPVASATPTSPCQPVNSQLLHAPLSPHPPTTAPPGGGRAQRRRACCAPGRRRGHSARRAHQPTPGGRWAAEGTRARLASGRLGRAWNPGPCRPVQCIVLTSPHLQACAPPRRNLPTPNLLPPPAPPTPHHPSGHPLRRAQARPPAVQRRDPGAGRACNRD